MKKIVIITIAILLVGISAYLFLDKKQVVKNSPPKNETVLIFGDSLAEGVGSTSGNDLSNRLSRQLKKPVLNYGRSGDTTRDALDRVPAVVEENAGMVIVILGGNDFLKKIPNEETFDNLEKIVTSFQDKGAVVVLVGVRSGLIGDGRGEEYLELAKKTESYYVSDILDGLFGDTRYMSDAIHPNDAGYALIEDRFQSVMADILEK